MQSVTGSTSCCLAGQLQSWPSHSTIRRLPESASRLAVSPLYPGCLSLPNPLVWMNISFLTPWLSDFHTVLFFVSSGCVLFLNCCCPSFVCARTHSVSTYASILAKRPEKASEVFIHQFPYLVEGFSWGRFLTPWYLFSSALKKKTHILVYGFSYNKMK